MFVYDYYESNARLNIFNEVVLIQKLFEAHVSFPIPTLMSAQVLIPRATERPAPGRFLTPFPRGLEDGLEGGFEA